MQKKFLFIAFSLCIFCFCTRETIRTDLELIGLQGKVKQITYTDLKISESLDGEISILFKSSETISYYDESGMHVIDEKSIFRVGSDEVTRVFYTFKHCPKGRKTESYMSVFDEEAHLHKKFSYNKKGLLREEISYDRSGNIELKTLYEYDETGRKIGEKATTGEGNPSSSIIYIYGQENDPIEKHIKNEISFFGLDDTLKYNFKYIFDDIGNWIERYDYESPKYGNPYAQYMQIRNIEYYP